MKASLTESDVPTNQFGKLGDILAAEGHDQASLVLYDLKQTNKNGYNKLQDEITDYIFENAKDDTMCLSLTVNCVKCDIERILCILPNGGTKVVLFRSVDDGGWFTTFTGKEWRIETKRLYGKKGSTYIEVNNIIVDCSKIEGIWVVTNITSEPKTNITFIYQI